MFDLSLCASRFLASFWLHSIRNYLQIASNFSFRSRTNLFMQNKINFNAKPEIVWNLAFFLANLIIIKQTEQFSFVYGLNNNNKIPAKKTSSKHAVFNYEYEIRINFPIYKTAVCRCVVLVLAHLNGTNQLVSFNFINVK